MTPVYQGCKIYESKGINKTETDDTRYGSSLSPFTMTRLVLLHLLIR